MMASDPSAIRMKVRVRMRMLPWTLAVAGLAARASPLAAFSGGRPSSGKSFAAAAAANAKANAQDPSAPPPAGLGGVRFAGDSESGVFVPHPPPLPGTTTTSGAGSGLRAAGGFRDRTLSAYLRSPDSDALLLGTPDHSYRPEDGLWECHQPPVDWFGMELAPVFVNRVDRPAGADVVLVDLVEARTDVASASASTSRIGEGSRARGGRRARAVGGLMERSRFSGSYELRWAPTEAGGGGWALTGDLKLELMVPLPKLLPVPPGFNALGSRIVRSTCQARVDAQLAELRDSYLEWASVEVEVEDEVEAAPGSGSEENALPAGRMRGENEAPMVAPVEK